MKKPRKHILVDQILLAQEEETMTPKKAKKKIQSKRFSRNDLYIAITIVTVMGGLIILSKC